jgi:hypothetical protein
VAIALSAKQQLLVLDNCEHVIDAAATMAKALLRANPAAQVVVTSREPLKAEGEWIYPVPLLAVPTRDAEDRDDLLRYGAVRDRRSPGHQPRAPWPGSAPQPHDLVRPPRPLISGSLSRARARVERGEVYREAIAPSRPRISPKA